MKQLLVPMTIGAGLVMGIMLSTNLSGGGGPQCPLATGQFDREAGASNQITTCVVLDALSLVETGRIVRLGRDYEVGMPVFPGRVFEFEQKMPSTVPEGQENDPRPTGGVFGDNRLIFNDGFLRSEIDQVGTQFDGLGHAGRAKRDDPRRGSYYLNLPVRQVNATPAEPEGGLRRLGVEHVKPIVTRGILVDLAPFGTADCDGHPCWDAGEEITLADITAALAAQGQSLTDITQGNAVFFNTGWGHLWLVNNARFNSGAPGIGLEVAEFLVNREVVLVGSDTWVVEVIPRSDGQFAPVHQRLITDAGIFLHEILTFEELIMAGVYEFAYVFMPVPIAGATGSPGSPLALF